MKRGCLAELRRLTTANLQGRRGCWESVTSAGRAPQESLTRSCPSLHHICCASHLPTQQETRNKGTEGLPWSTLYPRQLAAWTGRLPCSLAVHKVRLWGTGQGRRRMGLRESSAWDQLHPCSAFMALESQGMEGTSEPVIPNSYYQWRFCPRETIRKLK